MGKLNKDRVKRHMAREVPPAFVMWLDAYDLTMPGGFYNRDHIFTEDYLPLRMRRVYRHWTMLMQHKGFRRGQILTTMLYELECHRYKIVFEAREAYGVKTPST